jgi:hypothetical protein
MAEMTELKNQECMKTKIYIGYPIDRLMLCMSKQSQIPIPKHDYLRKITCWPTWRTARGLAVSDVRATEVAVLASIAYET